MRQIRQIRSEVYRETLARSSEEQQPLEQELAREYGLDVRAQRSTGNTLRQQRSA
jgi:hypothetical protein